jgi:hypothetical protein
MADTEDSRAKKRAYQREWKAANPEKAKAIDRASRARNRVKRAAANQVWKAANRDKTRAWREANREKINAQKRALRAADRAKIAAQYREWGAANPEKMAYHRHKSAARRRRIPFLLTFEQWWEIWFFSGKWEQRGRRKGQYCMARFGDLGGYEVGNVRIILGRDNLAEADQSYRSRPRSDEWRRNLSDGLKDYYARIRHANGDPHA